MIPGDFLWFAAIPKKMEMQTTIGFTMVFAHGAVQKRNRPDFASSCFSFCFSVSFWVCFGSVLVRFWSVLGPFWLRFGKRKCKKPLVLQWFLHMEPSKNEVDPIAFRFVFRVRSGPLLGLF